MRIHDRGPGQAGRGPGWESELVRRALSIWPRLDRAALRRCKDDPHRIAALVARRTSLPRESIVQMLTLPPVSSDEGAIWFG